MGAIIDTLPDDKTSIYLDPWHRTKFGSFGRFDPGTADRAELGSEAWVDSRGARLRPKAAVAFLPWVYRLGEQKTDSLARSPSGPTDLVRLPGFSHR
jgi:hypothetical protein